MEEVEGRRRGGRGVGRRKRGSLKLDVRRPIFKTKNKKNFDTFSFLGYQCDFPDPFPWGQSLIYFKNSKVFHFPKNPNSKRKSQNFTLLSNKVKNCFYFAFKFEASLIISMSKRSSIWMLLQNWSSCENKVSNISIHDENSSCRICSARLLRWKKNISSIMNKYFEKQSKSLRSLRRWVIVDFWSFDAISDDL